MDIVLDVSKIYNRIPIISEFNDADSLLTAVF